MPDPIPLHHVDESKPGAGGWTPPQWAPWATGVAVAVIAPVSTALLQPETSWRAVLAAALGGLAAGLGSALAMRSAGPRRLDR